MTLYMASPSNFTAAKRWIPLAVIVCLMVAAYILGLHEHLNLQNIAAHREELRLFIADNWPLALLIYAAVYVVAAALSFPAAGFLTVIGGLLFGWLVGAIATTFAATTGATIIFLAARTSLEKVLARKSGPLLGKIREGFARDAFNYLLFLRLVPLFPFWLVNIAAALAHLPLKTFVSATFFGIIPVTTSLKLRRCQLWQRHRRAKICPRNLPCAEWFCQLSLRFFCRPPPNPANSRWPSRRSALWPSSR